MIHRTILYTLWVCTHTHTSVRGGPGGCSDNIRQWCWESEARNKEDVNVCVCHTTPSGQIVALCHQWRKWYLESAQVQPPQENHTNQGALYVEAALHWAKHSHGEGEKSHRVRCPGEMRGGHARSGTAVVWHIRPRQRGEKKTSHSEQWGREKWLKFFLGLEKIYRHVPVMNKQAREGSLAPNIRHVYTNRGTFNVMTLQVRHRLGTFKAMSKRFTTLRGCRYKYLTISSHHYLFRAALPHFQASSCFFGLYGNCIILKKITFMLRLWFCFAVFCF